MAIYVDGTKQTGSGGGGTGGGHIFLDNEGTAMPQRAKAKFEGAYSTDNSTDGITNVAVMRTMKAMEYAQLTEEEKQGIIYVDDETTSTDDKFQPVIYSTEEREIGVWTNGKPLYEKTWITSSPSQKDVSEMVVDLSGYNVDNVITQDASIVNAGGLNITVLGGGSFILWYRTPLSSTTPKDCIMCIVSNEAYLSGTLYVTLQYTKATDTAGSGQWTPQGVPAVHYSTDEKVVGTWIDGSTIYEKTYDVSSSPIDLSPNTWVDTQVSATNITRIINFSALSTDGSNIGWLGVSRNGNYIRLQNVRNSSIPIAIFTIQYTKTS